MPEGSKRAERGKDGYAASAEIHKKERIGQDRPKLVVVEGITLTNPADLYLSVTALAHYAGLSPRRLRDLLKDPVRPLPHYRIGGRILVRRSEYDAWARHYRQVGDPDVERVVAEALQDL